MKLRICPYFVMVGLLTVLFSACTSTQAELTAPQDESRANEWVSSRIAYPAGRDGRRSIYVWDLNERKEKRLTGDLEDIQLQFSWSPDGSRLVFQNGSQDEEFELYVVNVHNGEIEQLTDNNTADENPDWSPCGGWIAFQSGFEAMGGRRIWVINPESRERKLVINDPRLFSDISSSWPFWSPQATRLAVISPAGEDTVVWGIFDVRTGRMMQLIKHDGAEVSVGPKMAAWRPDGKVFAYASNHGGSFDLYTQVVDGERASTSEKLTDLAFGEPRRLTDLTCNTRMPVWHPDEPTILFTCLDLNQNEEVEGQLYTVNVETLDVRQLTSEGVNVWGDWSPDGKQIAYTTKRNGAYYLVTMNSDGSNPNVIEETKSEGMWMPRWAPVRGLGCDQPTAVPMATSTPQPTATPLGPTTIILAPDVSDDVNSASLDAARDVLQNRLDSVLERKAQVSVDAGNLRVDLASGDDVTSTIQLAAQIGTVVFYGSELPVEVGSSIPEDATVILTDDDISQAQAVLSLEAEWLVYVFLTPEGAEKFSKYIEASTDRYLAIAHEGSVTIAFSLQEFIPGDQGVISRNKDRAFAESLAAQLNSGRLPFKLVPVEVIK